MHRVFLATCSDDAFSITEVWSTVLFQNSLRVEEISRTLFSDKGSGFRTVRAEKTKSLQS